MSPAIAYVIDDYIDTWLRRHGREQAARGETLLLPPA